MTSWKNICLIIPSFIMPYFICGILGVSQNIFSDYFYRLNCSVSDGVVFQTYNRIECASKCLSDDLCEGFQTVRINTNSALCSIFNISSARHVNNSDKNTYIKTYLLSQFREQCTNPVTSYEETSTIQSEQKSTTNLHTSTDPQTTMSIIPITTTTVEAATLKTTEPATTSTESATTTVESTTITTEPTSIETESTTTTVETTTFIPTEPTTTETESTTTTVESTTITTEPTTIETESTTTTVETTTFIPTEPTTTETESTTTTATTTSPTTTTTTTTLSPTTTTTATTTTTSPTTTVESIVYSCNVDAALYITSSGETWIFFNSYIQIYTSLSDLTTSNFRREKLTDIFSDAPAVVEAGYFDGTNIVLIKDQEAYIYSSSTPGSTVQNKLSTDTHFGHSVPSVIDAVIVNGNNDLFIFSNNQVTRITSGTDTFSFGNNGNSNYYRATNNNERPDTVTAGVKVDSVTHYLFNANQIKTFTEGSKKGTFYNTGDVLCN